jgi:hypothetical protein
MGLDMYAFATRKAPSEKVDFPQHEEDFELHYWRKHPNLHGWMQRLYRAKGGTAEQFNLATVILETDDLDQLEADICVDRLPETAGFFFGRSDSTEKADDLMFVRAARRAIAEGLSVYYTSWW